MKILINAYASEPGAGSEYGVGWMVPVTMAKQYSQHEIYVLTRSRCKEKIVKALNELHLHNLHFLFYDIPQWLTYKNEMQSHWGEQINYLLWQILVRKYIRKQNEIVKFDVIHHLTFNQYRTPSPGFWLDIPFVFGPIGGAETVAPAFWQDLEPHSKRKEIIRSRGRDLKVFKWFTTRRKNKKIILCSCGENLRRLQEHAGNCKLIVLPAIAFSKQDFPYNAEKRELNENENFEMIYAGKAWDWKGILIFLKAAKEAFLGKGRDNWNIKLIGIRFEEEKKKVNGWIDELGLSDYVTLIPFLQRSELLKMMQSCSLSIYPAFRDSGSMSVLEASALGCPTICFNAGGQDIFPDDILLKVNVTDDYNSTLHNFAAKLDWAYTHRRDITKIGEKAKKWVSVHLTWEKKVEEFMDIYENMIWKN